MISPREWLASLHVGQKVIIKNSNYGQHDSLGIVAKILMTQIRIQQGEKITNFTKIGRAVGDHGFHNRYLFPWTPEAQVKILRETKERATLALLDAVRRPATLQALTDDELDTIKTTLVPLIRTTGS